MAETRNPIKYFASQFFLFCLLFPISTSSVKQPQKAVMENKSYYSANIILTPRP